MALALVTAIVLRRPSMLPWKRRLATWMGAIAGAGIGAKLPFLLAGDVLFGDGKTLLSGFAGGYLGVEIAKLAAGIREKTGDAFAVPLAASVAVGRWGCFFNGCCGAPWAPIAESAFHAGMAVMLWTVEGVESLRWQLLKLYLICYGVFRFGMEFARSEPRIAWGLTPYHFGAAGLTLMMTVLWIVDDRRKARVATPPGGVSTRTTSCES